MEKRTGSNRTARSIVWRCPWAMQPARKRKQCLADMLNPDQQHVRNNNNALTHYFSLKLSSLSLSSFFFLWFHPSASDTVVSYPEEDLLSLYSSSPDCSDTCRHFANYITRFIYETFWNFIGTLTMLHIHRLTYIGLITKWLRILSLGGNGKIRNHLVANPIDRLRMFVHLYVDA